MEVSAWLMGSWTAESGVTTFHLIHHPVMDMGSQSLTGLGGAVARAEGTNGVKDMAGEGSQPPQHGAWKNKWGRWMEKRVARIEVKDIWWGIRWTASCLVKCLLKDKDGLSLCFHMLWRTGRLCVSFCFSCFTVHHAKAVLQLTAVKEQPSPIQMMNLVIRRSHSIPKISLRCNESQRATCSLHPLKRRATSSIFRAAEEKLTSVWRCSSGAQWWAHTPTACWESVHAGVAARCSDNEKHTSNRHGPSWVTPRCGRTHTQMLLWNGFTDIWPRSSRCLSTPESTVVLCMIICFPLSQLNPVMSRHFFLSFLLLHCLYCAPHVKSLLFQEVERDSFPSCQTVASYLA